MKTFTCIQCGKTKPVHKNGGTGYGLNENKEKICYDCCGDIDRQYMRDHDKTTLYLDTKSGLVSNWPGTLKIKARHVKTGKHNICGIRYDVWFSFEGAEWHGVTFGDNTQICHCRKLKAK